MGSAAAHSQSGSGKFGQLRTKRRKSVKAAERKRPIRWEIGPMTLIEKERLINDMLAETCDLMGKMIALIPPEHPELRLSACASSAAKLSWA